MKLELPKTSHAKADDSLLTLSSEKCYCVESLVYSMATIKIRKLDGIVMCWSLAEMPRGRIITDPKQK